MFRIINRQILAEDLKRVDVQAEAVARLAQPGQFVMVTLEEGHERFPLSIVESDPRRGIITLVVRETGPATRRLGQMGINDQIYALLGPLGRPVDTEVDGVVVCVASGIGTAQILPICRALKARGNKVISILGGANRKAIMLTPQMRLACTKLLITTDDGSFDKKGMATDLLRTVLEQEEVVKVYAAGSVRMMKAVTEITEEADIPTRVQVNTMMLCGTGGCGACRVRVDGQIVQACEEGPDFDGHTVDFDFLRQRMNAFQPPAGVLAPPGTSGFRGILRGVLGK